MNRLSTKKRAQIISCLIEGNSLRATSHKTCATKNSHETLRRCWKTCCDYQKGNLLNLAAKVSRLIKSDRSAMQNRRM